MATNNIHQVKMPDVEKYTLHTSIRQAPKHNIDNVNLYKFELFKSKVDRTRATLQTGIIKMGAGLMDILEFVGDGELWALGKVFDGATYSIADGIGNINPNAESAILDFRSKVDEWIIDDMAFDITNTLEDEVFNTERGAEINRQSYMKRDSAAAEGIEKITKFGGEVAIATGATVASGGAASPTLFAALGLGTAEGFGEKGNKLYQQSKGTSTAKEASIFFSGLSKGAQYYAMGRLGQNVINAGSKLTATVAHGPYGQWNTPSTLGEAGARLHSSLDPGTTNNIVIRALERGVIRPDNAIDISNGVVRQLADATEKGMSIKEAGGRIVVDGLIVNVAFNSILEGLGIYTGGMHAMKHFAPTLDGNLLSLADPIINSVDAAEDSDIIDISVYDKITSNAN